MKRTTDMTVGSPAKHLLTFALPLIVTNIGQQFYMIVDGSIVGRGVGVKALAAVGASDWLYYLILWTVVGLTQGVSTFVARYFGEKNYAAMNRAITMCTLLCAAVGGILTAAGLLTTRPLLQLLNTPADIMDDAALYFTTLMSGMLIVTAYNVAASVLRALGDSRTPLFAMIIAALTNIGLDLLFVFGLHMGIFGAGLASVLAQLASFLYCFFRLRKIDCIRLDKETWKPDRELLRSLIVFGLPLTLGYSVVGLGGVIVQSAANLQGSIFIAGYAATNKVYGLLECSSISLGIATSTFLAQNYGAGNYGRFKQGVRAAAGISLLLSLLVSGITLAAGNPFMRLFLDVAEEGGAEAHAVAVYYLNILAVFLSMLYLLHIFRNALQALQISLWPMLSGFAELAARVFMAKAAIHFMGSDALFFAEPAAWLAALLFVSVPYVYYRRKRLVLAPESLDRPAGT